jgi:oxygen-independent coproporphyrinogen III oxidase
MAGVYISWPFCAQKCTYCNFASGVFPRELEAEYLDALCAEIQAAAWNWRPETVYFGGGTPSSMEPGALERILQLIPGRPWSEATLEAAPGSLQRERVEAWRSLGINRVSLGVQSFVEKELRQTGRKHTAEGVERDVELLRSCGIEEINIDLIAGLPAQTRKSWSESLRWIERLAPPHVSVYMFEIDEDSRLGKEMMLGGVRYGANLVPDEDTTVALYEEAVERLAAAGVPRYEISNFARPGHESKHNLKYWRLEPYLGFGADAHSLDGGQRWQNSESVTDYVARWKRGEVARVEETPAIPREERFFVGLRLMEGVEPTPEERVQYAGQIAELVEAGLLEDTGVRIRLTPRGVLISNEVFQEFIGSECPIN